jgi:hypothetical protein
MLEHAARALEVAAGKKESKQAFLGKMTGSPANHRQRQVNGCA